MDQPRFLVIGAACTAWGVVLLLVLPNSPVTTIWLTREERLMAVARLRKNQVKILTVVTELEPMLNFLLSQTGITNRTFKMDQAKEFFVDIKTVRLRREPDYLTGFLAYTRSLQYLFFFLGFVANIPNGGCVEPLFPIRTKTLSLTLFGNPGAQHLQLLVRPFNQPIPCSFVTNFNVDQDSHHPRLGLQHS